jgi:putative chitinase
MTINWKLVQLSLGVTPDGVPGRRTYTALFEHMAPKASPTILASLGNAAAVHFPKYGAAENAARLADFLAETCNESGGYSQFEENLNYSAKRLMEVWPSRFPSIAEAQPYANNPVQLANKVYGGRMGNIQPGDGWAYRGRGLLELTGRGNYEGTDRRLGIGLDINPDLAAVPALSLLIALDFYTTNNVWSVLDTGHPIEARKITNGGTVGLDNVNILRARAMEIIG